MEQNKALLSWMLQMMLELQILDWKTEVKGKFWVVERC
jgi:hypothetical protein